MDEFLGWKRTENFGGEIVLKGGLRQPVSKPKQETTRGNRQLFQDNGGRRRWEREGNRGGRQFRRGLKEVQRLVKKGILNRTQGGFVVGLGLGKRREGKGRTSKIGTEPPKKPHVEGRSVRAREGGEEGRGRQASGEREKKELQGEEKCQKVEKKKSL